MPIPKTSSYEFKEHLISLGLQEGQNLAIHSNMTTFGKLERGVENAYHIIRSVIGEKGTIVVPTYTTNLSKGEAYDPKTSPAQNMGVFSNYILNREGSVRTPSPLQSHAIEGPLKDKLLKANHNHSMGPGSIFEIMLHENFDLLLLGCSFNEGATFIHHVEASVGVSYRKWLNLKRKIVCPNGSIKQVTIRYYGLTKNSGLKTDLKTIQCLLQDAGSCLLVSINHGASRIISLKTLFEDTSRLLSEQPNILMVPEQNE